MRNLGWFDAFRFFEIRHVDFHDVIRDVTNHVHVTCMRSITTHMLQHGVGGTAIKYRVSVSMVH